MSDDNKREIKEAVAQERAEHQADQAEKEAAKESAEPQKGKGYFDRLKLDFDDNHLGDARRFSEQFDGKIEIGRAHV